jgi:hypothetical protein
MGLDSLARTVSVPLNVQVRNTPTPPSDKKLNNNNNNASTSVQYTKALSGNKQMNSS